MPSSWKGMVELLTTIYEESSVSHLLFGKTVSRALWADFFVRAAFISKLIDDVLPAVDDQLISQLSNSADVAEADEGEITFSMEEKFASVENEARSSMSNVHQDNTHDVVQGYLPEKLELSNVDEINDLYNELQVHEISEAAESTLMHELRNKSRTAKLWLAYIEYISMLKLFLMLREQRIGIFILWQ